jgi:hypothetical protein
MLYCDGSFIHRNEKGGIPNLFPLSKKNIAASDKKSKPL